MKLRSARQVIHDAYALHLMGKSTGIDPKVTLMVLDGCFKLS